MMFWNPVCNLLYQLYASDIPEWTYHEGLGKNDQFDIAKDLTDEEILKLNKNSPGLLEFDTSSKTKLLLIIGDGDLRVSPKASYYLYKKWKKLGLDVDCKVYPK